MMRVTVVEVAFLFFIITNLVKKFSGDFLIFHVFLLNIWDKIRDILYAIF